MINLLETKEKNLEEMFIGSVIIIPVEYLKAKEIYARMFYYGWENYK